jgi:hypothetical protein
LLDRVYNDVMDNNNRKQLAIKWGTGYRILKEPYMGNSDFPFTYGYVLPSDTVVVETDEACKVITAYLSSRGITDYHVTFGIMAFILIDGGVVLRSRNKGICGIPRGIKPSTGGDIAKRTNIRPLLNSFIKQSDVINKDNLDNLLKELRRITDIISRGVHSLPENVWKRLYYYDGSIIEDIGQRKKIAVFSHYSNGDIKCNRCGLNDIRALSIDHINGGGSKHIKEIRGGRLGSNFYHWLIKNNYPPGYQILCMSCQWIKRSENRECKGNDRYKKGV